jgi:hypothetical protein
MKSINDFIGFEVGDIITLSDIQTQKEFKEMEVDFKIIQTREYRHPNGVFAYTGYIASYQATPEDEEQQIMLLVRQIGDDFDLQVYYMDNEGTSEEFEALFVENEEDLLDRFEVQLHFGEEDLDVTWDRQGPTNFGVNYSSSDDDEDDEIIKTLAEYFTNDDTRGNPYCLIEWSGDKVGGYVEIWYGCEITVDDVEIFHTN